MKKSLRNNQGVAHVWAAQTQTEGYANNMFFEGPSIYSYGKHFEIARIVKPGIVLFNNRSYSVSTSKHQSYTHSAVSHMKSFAVPSMTDHDENAAALIKGLEDELFRISRMRKDASFWLEQYAKLAEKARDYTATFKVKKALVRRIDAIYAARENPLTPAQLEKLKARADADKERARLQRIEDKKNAENLKLKLQADYDAWKIGKIASLPWQAQNLFPVALRITTDDDGGRTIQTSRGARVPVDEAIELYHALMKSPDVAGRRIGSYTVTGVRGTNLIVGCHTIPLMEVARMSRALNLPAATF